MFKKTTITLILILCLAMSSIVSFAQPVDAAEIPSENALIIDFENQSIYGAKSSDFSGTFNGNGTCTITGVPNTGVYDGIFLQNVPGKNITCTISGNSNLTYTVKYLYSGFPATAYYSNVVRGDGSTTQTTRLGYTGNYYVSIIPYEGGTNGQKLTLVFKSW